MLFTLIMLYQIVTFIYICYLFILHIRKCIFDQFNLVLQYESNLFYLSPF